jgi:2-amino-4-hydroxy-6-hydroxymethyldihydropteridine diphosphokinase
MIPAPKGCSWHVSRRFPWRGACGRGADALVGVGGNLGRVPDRFDRMVDYLRRNGRVRVCATSPLLKNPPFGYTEQPDFFNGVMRIRTALPPLALLRYLLWVERRFGRRRSFKNAPRTLDLDIIFYENRRMRTRRLRLPHPGYTERPSVLWPLALMEGGVE